MSPSDMILDNFILYNIIPITFLNYNKNSPIFDLLCEIIPELFGSVNCGKNTVKIQLFYFQKFKKNPPS